MRTYKPKLPVHDADFRKEALDKFRLKTVSQAQNMYVCTLFSLTTEASTTLKIHKPPHTLRVGGTSTHNKPPLGVAWARASSMNVFCMGLDLRAMLLTISCPIIPPKTAHAGDTSVPAHRSIVSNSEASKSSASTPRSSQTPFAKARTVSKLAPLRTPLGSPEKSKAVPSKVMGDVQSVWRAVQGVLSAASIRTARHTGLLFPFQPTRIGTAVVRSLQKISVFSCSSQWTG